MPSTDPWDAFPTVDAAPVTAAPAYPGVIPGRPKAPEPISAAEAVRLRLAENADTRAQSEFEQRNAVAPTPGDTTLTGDDYLKTLDPGVAGQVKALSEGRRAFPTGTALKDPKIQELIAAATQYDPALDAANAATRVNTRKDFTSGVSARNVTALNTALHHLASLKNDVDALHNRGWQTWNKVGNALLTEFGDQRVTNFNEERDAVASELRKVFATSGGGGLQELQDWQNHIDAAQSPKQLNGAIAKAIDLMGGRLQALNDQYTRGMGQSKDPLELLSPSAQQIYSDLVNDQPIDPSLLKLGLPGGGNTPPPITPSGPTGSSPSGGPAPSPFDDGTPGASLATGATKNVFDPKTAAGLNGMVQQGRPYAEAAAFAQQNGFQPPSPEKYAAALAWQKAHPRSPYDAANPTRPAATTAREQAASSSLGAAAIAAGDAASGFTLDNIVGATGGNAEQARQDIAATEANSPVASALGTVTGGAVVSLGGEAALGRMGLTAGLPRAILADTAYGAGAGAGVTDQGNRLIGAGKGALAAAGGSFLGNKAGGALSGMARGVSDASVNALRKEGVNALTIGQTYANAGKIGQAAKSIEDRLSGLPVVGDAVKFRQAEAFRQFNAKAFDKALEPIGETVAGQTGEQAIQTAQDKVSKAFTKALSGKGAIPDNAFVQDLTHSIGQIGAIKKVGVDLRDEIGDILKPYANDQMLSGEALDDISRSLRGLKSRYAKSQDPVAGSPRVAKAIDGVERSIFDLFDRQASGTIPEYRSARQAYRRLSILEDSVNKARNQKDRLFTPAQLGQADRSNATKFTGKRQAAAGNTPFYDLQTAAQDVLPNKVPDSGTAGRLLVPLALLGGGEGIDKVGGTDGKALTIGAILAALYSKSGQRLLTKPGRGINSATVRRILQSDASKQALTAVGASSAVALTS